MTKKLIYIAFFFLLLPSCLWAACTGSSPNWQTTADRTSANTCITNASAGDTVTFPLNGSATWASEITLVNPITINGNGTTIALDAPATWGAFFLYGMSSSTLMRITGFTFQMTDFSRNSAIRGYNNNLTNFRLDHNTFHHGAVQVDVGGVNGVIDANYFYNGGSAIYLSGGSRSFADSSWISLAAGTVNALFVEDNNFIINADVTASYSQIIDEDNGGKYVIRHNYMDVTLDSKTGGSQQYIFQNHGNACGGCDSITQAYWQNDDTGRRSPSLNEFYSNTIKGTTIGRFATFRGGAGLVYNNTVTSTTYNPTIVMYEEESGLPSQFSPSRTAWPAEDQVHNFFFWNNTSNGTQINSNPNTYLVVVNSDPYFSAEFIQKGRDYFAHAPCSAQQETSSDGYSCQHGKETFTGANGASGSYPTDGETYPTEGTMVFTETGDNAYYGYTPYTYPHPLRVQKFTGNIMIGGAGLFN